MDTFIQNAGTFTGAYLFFSLLAAGISALFPKLRKKVNPLVVFLLFLCIAVVVVFITIVISVMPIGDTI